MQLVGDSAADVATRLVDDWAARNFVTAGGFAIEELAIGVGENVEKSSTEGIDLQEYTDTGGTLDYDLYVLKSGPVTQNSDILKALKTNSRKAEQLLRQKGPSAQSRPTTPSPPARPLPASRTESTDRRRRSSGPKSRASTRAELLISSSQWPLRPEPWSSKTQQRCSKACACS